MHKKLDLKNIFDNDPYGLLDTDPIPESKNKSQDQRLIESFKEISAFFEKNGREPLSQGIEEFRLYARLEAIKKNPNKVKLLLPYDFHQLLINSKSIPAEDIIKDDPLGILVDDEVDRSIYKLKFVRPSERIKPDLIARRKKCLEFQNYGEAFNCIHEELKEGRRKLIEFNFKEVEEGKFYVLNGIVLLLEHINAETNSEDFKSGSRTRLDGRTRCIFDNGTESTLLLRSLIKAMQLDGFAISEPISAPLNPAQLSNDDEQNGYIYILKSKSKLPSIAKIQPLFKIGFSCGDVTLRIRSASKEPTYLMDEVQIVSVFKCYNMSTNKLEVLIHQFFDEMRLNIELIDSDGMRYHPREWFTVPIEIIEEAINLLVNDDINKYKYDSRIKKIVIRS